MRAAGLRMKGEELEVLRPMHAYGTVAALRHQNRMKRTDVSLAILPTQLYPFSGRAGDEERS